jgi:hypothetical protein
MLAGVRQIWPRRHYRKDCVDNIHQAKYYIADPRLMISITRKHQGACNDMVREHLNVILSSIFYIHHEYLLQPKGKLHEVVPFGETVHFPVWPIDPEIVQVEPVIRTVHYVLLAG